MQCLSPEQDTSCISKSNFFIISFNKLFDLYKSIFITYM